MTTASLGGEFEVPTIDGGRTRVKIPEGTQTGKRLRLPSKGMPVLRSKSRGDMYVQVTVETPQKLTKRQKDLLKEFENVTKHLSSFAKAAKFVDKMVPGSGGPGKAAYVMSAAEKKAIKKRRKQEKLNKKKNRR